MKLMDANGTVWEPRLARHERRHLAEVTELWAKYPLMPRVLLLARDPSPQALPERPALELYGHDGSELETTKNLLEVFGVPEDVRKAAARVNVYPFVLAESDDWACFVPDQRCTNQIRLFVSERIDSLIEALPCDRQIWLAAFGQVARAAIGNHLGIAEPYPRFVRHPVRCNSLRASLVLAHHPSPRSALFRNSVQAVRQWLESGLMEAQSAHRARPRVQLGDTVRLRYPGKHFRTVRIVKVRRSADKAEISAEHPLAEALLGSELEQEVAFIFDKRELLVVVESICKPADLDRAEMSSDL